MPVYYQKIQKSGPTLIIFPWSNISWDVGLKPLVKATRCINVAHDGYIAHSAL